MKTTSPDDRDAEAPLLGEADLPPARIINPHGLSSFLLVGDHAGALIPSALGKLGLSPDDLSRHIALDIGVQALGEALSVRLDAAFISQRYSRLVIDCNRAPLSPEAMPATSYGTVVPGNASLTAIERVARISEIHTPYQDAITHHLARRAALGIESILVSLHSFTPVMEGVERPWHVGVLYDRGDTSFATSMLEHLSRDGDLIAGDNEPYRMDSTDYTVPLHAFATGRPYVELEIRQDLVVSEAGVAFWSGRVARALSGSSASLRFPKP